MNLTTAKTKKRGGLYRLKNKEEVMTHGNEEYEKLKIQPRNHNEYRTLHSYVVNFLQLFEFPRMKSLPPDEWSQYMTIELVDQDMSKEETIQLLSRLGFWSTVDDDTILLDLADVDLKLLENVLPYELISFKTISEKFQEEEVVTPEHFIIERLSLPSVSEQVFKEKKTRKPRTPKNGHEVPIHLNGNGVLKVPEKNEEEKPKESLPHQHDPVPMFGGNGRSSIATFARLTQGNNARDLVRSTPSFALGLNNEVAREVFGAQFGIEHRLEEVATIEGVRYVNDSKATNINSTWFALESIYGPIIWICGGQDKGNDYTPLLEVVKEKVKGVICLGKDSSKIRNAFSQIIPLFFETESMEQAVRQAYAWSTKGGTVVLSPGCASFDLFDNFEDRGQKFKQAVRSI